MKFSKSLNKLTPNFSSKVINTETLIKEVRNVDKLIPLEVELSQTITVDNSFYDLEIFKKTKNITFFAKCSYYIDLSGITSKNMTLNTPSKELTLTVPSPKIYSINIDENKTVYSEPELGLLRFGDLTLSTEDYGKIRNSLYTLFEDKLREDNFYNQATSNTKKALEKLLFQITNENYDINILIED